MKLLSSYGSFELSILGYGNEVASWHGQNSLLCRFSTNWRQQSDTQSVPLKTWEVSRLVNGLRSLWNRAVSHIDFTFSEPGLSVEATALPNEKYQLQIQLDHQLTPSWHSYPGFPVELNVLLNRAQLQEAIQDLSNQLASYPER